MKYYFSLVILIFGAILLAPTTVRSAEFFFVPNESHEGPGFTADVMVGFDQAINAVEGIVVFDNEKIALDFIADRPGGAPIWINPPALNDEGAIEFAGIFPGGIEPKLVNQVPLFTVTFRALQTGRTDLSIQEVEVFLNGPSAVQDSVTTRSLGVIIEEEDLGEIVVPDDDLAPEPFKIEIARNIPLEEARSVAIFSTRDLQSGISSYEIRQRFLGLPATYQPVEGISQLSVMWPWSIIEVRATDRAGNSATARYIPSTLYALYVLFGVFIIWRVRRSRR